MSVGLEFQCLHAVLSTPAPFISTASVCDQSVAAAVLQIGVASTPASASMQLAPLSSTARPRKKKSSPSQAIAAEAAKCSTFDSQCPS